MSYQIHIRDSEGNGFLAAKFDDLTEAQKELAFMVEAAGTSDLLIAQPDWKTIDLYRIELISSISMSSEKALP
jgi:hypothetical protein